jgi:hypothetical protein
VVSAPFLKIFPGGGLSCPGRFPDVLAGVGCGKLLALCIMWENISKTVRFLLTGQFQRVWNEVHVRLYRAAWAVLWYFLFPFRRAGRIKPQGVFSCETRFPVAFKSPDHIAPKGTAVNNSTHKRFVLHMDEKLHREF